MEVFVVMIHPKAKGEESWIHSTYSTDALAEQVCKDLNAFFNGDAYADFKKERVRDTIEE